MHRFTFGLVCLLALPLHAQEFTSALLFSEALVATEEKISGDPYADSSSFARQQTDAFIAGLVGSAWRLSHYARHLNNPSFSRGDEFTGLPGLFNPDNLYRNALLEDSGQYRISGERGSHTHLTFQFIDRYPMIGLSKDLMVIDLSEHEVNPGDRFEFFLGGPERSGLWWPVPAGTKAVLVRQTFSDWQSETPTSLSIERLDADRELPEGPDRLTLASHYLEKVTTLWADNYMTGLRRLPFNVMAPMRPSKDESGGLSGQQGVMARFRIQEDEAMIITSRLSDAGYQAIQLGNYWFVTPNPVMYQSSLNSNQVHVDEDGYIRYVISLFDPGVANWLNPGGSNEGYIYMRWQDIRTPLTEQDQPMAEKVRLEDLDEHLPPNSVRLSPSERMKQLAARIHFPTLKR